MQLKNDNNFDGYNTSYNDNYSNYNNNYNSGYNNNYNTSFDSGNNYGYNNYNAAYNNSYGNNGGYNYNYGSANYNTRDEISPQTFNLIIGAVLLYGFLINCFMITFCFDAVASLNPIAFLVIYFVLAIAGTIMIRKSDNPVISFVGYNLMVVPIGLVLTLLINAYALAGMESTVMTAFVVTAIVTIAMMAISSIFPAFFLSLGRTLGVTLLITIVIELILTLVGASLGIVDYIVVLLFCGYVGYDWQRANAMPKTVDNAIDCASELYLDIANLFIRILRILSRAND